MSRKKKKAKASEQDPAKAPEDRAEVLPLPPEMGGGCGPPLWAFAISIVAFVGIVLPGVQALGISDRWAALLALAGWAGIFFGLVPIMVKLAARKAQRRAE